MRFPAGVLVGCILVFILSVSSYMTIVEAAAALRPASMINSFSVESLRHASSARSFSIGDTLVIEAESDVACSYDLRVSDNSSLVYEARSPGGSPVKMEVPLLPPTFKAGSSYTLSLNCFAVNTPLPGAFSVDSASYTFDVSGTQTTLSLFSVYDDLINWLYASSNLTDADGNAVANETVGFYLQLKSQPSLTDGWIPLGTSVTDDNGTATITSGFPLLYQMAVKACFDGDANYGACENITDVQVITGFIHDHLCPPYETGGAGQTGGIPLDDGNVSISMDTNCTYYHMSPNVTVQYTSNSQLTGSMENLTIFYLDNFSRCLGASQNMALDHGSPPYVYQVSWYWLGGGPQVTGVHKLIAGILPVSDPKSISLAQLNGTGIIASGNMTLNITGCLSNLVLHLPDTAYGNVLPVSVGYCSAWPNAANNTGAFTTSSLASQVVYDGVTYAFNKPVSASVPVSLHVNGFNMTNMTDTNGLASFQCPLSPSGANSSVSINCTADGSSVMIQPATVKRNVTLTWVNISDVSNALSGNGTFGMGFTVNGQGSTAGLENGTVYVGTQNTVGLTAPLKGSGVQAAPAALLIGKPVARAFTDSSGWVKVPSNSTPMWLREASLYNISTTSAYNAATDVNHDSKTDGKDVALTSIAFGAVPGSQKWNWRLDVNFDGKVDGKDVAMCAACFGSVINYLAVPDYSVVNVRYNKTDGSAYQWPLDASGCVLLPNGSQSLRLFLNSSLVGGVVDFFNDTLYDAFHPSLNSTDEAGAAGASWTPANTASMPHDYVALAWLPSSFQAVTSTPISVTSVQDLVLNVTYISVVKRPVSLCLTNSPYLPQTVIDRTIAMDGYVQQPDGFTLGDHTDFLPVGYKNINGIQEFNTYMKFDVSSIPPSSTILSAKIKIRCDNGVDIYTENRTYQINRVTHSWDSSMTFITQPSSTYTSIFSWQVKQQGWWVWDVTRDVQSWCNDPATNFGHVIFDQNGADHECYCNLLSGDERLEVIYLGPGDLPIVLEANVTDPVTGDPLSSAGVNLSVNGTYLGSGSASWSPSSPICAVYDATATYAGDNVHEAALTSVWLDFRAHTSIGVNLNGNGLTDGQNVNVSVDEVNNLDCTVNPLIMATESVQVYQNGSLIDTAVLGGYLDPSFDWTAYSPGVYFLNFSYGGDAECTLSQLNIVAVAQVGPVCLGFNATPSELAPGDLITLEATTVNPQDGNPLRNVNVQFFYVNSEVGQHLISNTTTGPDGVARVGWQYPNDNRVYNVIARVVKGNSVGNCSLVEEPVTLTVGGETRFLLEVWRDQHDTGHTIDARLLDAGGNPLVGQTVTLNVNGTAYSLTTNDTGYVSLHLALLPGDMSANMYQVLAMFNGPNPRSATLNGSDPYGNPYAVCTTNQYDLRPSTNSSTLAVLLQTTDAITAAKTMKNMQGQAEQNGALTIYNEWSWWYPWYRLHVAINLNGSKIDVGFSPILPDIGTRQFYFPSQFLPPILITIDPTSAQQIVYNTLIGTAAEIFGLAGEAVVAANTHIPILSAAGFAVYAGGLISLLAYAWGLYSSGNKLEGLTALVGFAVNGIGTGLGGLLSLAYHDAASIFVDSLAFPILGAVLSNLANPQELILSIGSAVAILIAGLTIGLIALRLIPDPIAAWWYPAFITASFVFAITAFSLYSVWVR